MVSGKGWQDGRNAITLQASMARALGLIVPGTFGLIMCRVVDLAGGDARGSQSPLIRRVADVSDTNGSKSLAPRAPKGGVSDAGGHK